jgi:hypothetical protein
MNYIQLNKYARDIIHTVEREFPKMSPAEKSKIAIGKYTHDLFMMNRTEVDRNFALGYGIGFIDNHFKATRPEVVMQEMPEVTA